MAASLWQAVAASEGEALVRELGVDALPVCPFSVAAKLEIEVRPLSSHSRPGVSGILLRHGCNFGILYATYLDNEGFKRFCVGHEIGHFRLPGHPEAVFTDGIHMSHAGFTSKDRVELEADHFAAGLLMPSFLFDAAMDKAGSGLEAVEALAGCCVTSLTATAIRYAQRTPEATAIVVSVAHTIDYCFMSDSFREIGGLDWIRKGSGLPRSSVTYRFNDDTGNVVRGDRADGESPLQDWFGGNLQATLHEQVVGLGGYGFSGTPIDRTMQNTHRDFGPLKDGVQERYLSYYGIRRAIQDGATLEVHYLRDKVPFKVDEEPLSLGFEQMCAEMELEDEEAKDFVQRQRSQWKELARHPERVDIVLERMLTHFLEHPDPNGFKAQLVAVDRKACAGYKEALNAKLRARGLPPEWSDVIISAAQNSEPDVERFEYPKAKQDELIDYFKLTPAEWEAWNRERHGEDRHKWRPPLKILIVCDRLLTGFDAPVEQVMYLDKPLRDHNLLQAIARTNRPLPAMKKRTGVVVDYFGVFTNLEKALNFDESVREESLIDWDALRATVPGEVARCMELFEGITIADTRECLLAALRRLRDPEAAKNFEHNFRSLERLWEAVAPDPCLYPHRFQYNWLCGIYRNPTGPGSCEASSDGKGIRAYTPLDPGETFTLTVLNFYF